MKVPTVSQLRRYVRKRWEARRLAQRKRVYRSRRPRVSHKSVCFVIGCQRSGTTMTGDILDRMLDVDYFPEKDARAFDDMRIRSKAVRDELIARSSAACVAFKPICDSHRVKELLADHPRGKALWVYRRWSDVVNSTVTRWGHHWVEVMGDIVAGRGDWGWRQEGISEDCRRMIRRLCRSGQSAPEASAVFWYMRNRIFFDQGLDGNEAVWPIQYEAMVSDSEAEFGRVCRFLELEFDSSAVANVFSSSIGKKPCSVMNPAIIEACNDLWERLDSMWERASRAHR